MPLWRIDTASDDLDSDAVFNTSTSRPSVQINSSALYHRGSASPKPSSPRSPDTTYNPTGPFLVKTHPIADTNKNTSWFLYPGVWTMYFMILLFVWLMVLSIFRCSLGTAWATVNLLHAVVTFYLFHWKKGSPFGEDQGVYDKLTWWEQVDGGRQLTRSRKFLTCVPVVLYLITSYATRHSEFSSSILFLNTVVVFVLIIAKLPLLHQVRLFGINADYPS